ncbi:MAG: uracil-DNA glycosylase [Rhodobacteraceae bacterium]|jgi:uracil-DNA glycosylase family 4|nr:uracil-DNA glycosylase [Paracoccaceae bacterium]MBL4556899.1 uracil-DNA glycosylase [Paracoccaceae bacterium]HBG98393.1 uracil-DNA glycosylase [Paracoccaceae bacterium]
MTDRAALLAALDWQIELGATEAIGDAPVDRYALATTPAAAAAAPVPPAAPHPAEPAAPPAAPADNVAEARAIADAAADLPALRDALARFDRCDLKQGARNLVFADGDPAAALMILGEAPGRDEDLQGKPFVGRAGQLLDRMLAAIGRDRHADDPARGVYITNVLPWRPPQNRDPKPEEIAMLRPFVDRHIALVDPAVLVLMGNHACAAMLGRRGITRLRGQWAQAAGRPALPMFHPAYLLRNPAAKREAWADLLALQARLGP